MNWTEIIWSAFVPPLWLGFGYAAALMLAPKIPGGRPRALQIAREQGPSLLGGPAAGAVTGDIAKQAWIPLAVAAAWVCMALAWWFWRNRRRDRAPKLAGAKSRARLAALVAKLREAAKPKPSLRPVPGGAR